MKRKESVTREDAFRYACEQNGLIYLPAHPDISLEEEGLIRPIDTELGKAYKAYLESAEGKTYIEEIERYQLEEANNKKTENGEKPHNSPKPIKFVFEPKDPFESEERTVSQYN